jgi:hypothetical protein
VRSRSLSVCVTCIITLCLSACPTGGKKGEDHGWGALKLTLAQETVTAGTTANYKAELVGKDGSRHATKVTLTSNLEAALHQTEKDLMPTVAGDHIVGATATVEGDTLTGAANLTVNPGGPATIEISLTDETPSKEKPVRVNAVIADAHGNAVDAPWTLTVEAEPGFDSSAVNVSKHTVTFTTDGLFTATGTLDQEGISDDYGPFIVDSFAPTITFTTPERGTMTSATEDEVTGTIVDSFSEVVEATVNGESLTLGDDGSFSHAITHDVGMNLVETVAVDEGGNTVTDRRGVLSGEFRARGAGIADGVMVRVNQSTLDAVEVFGESLVDNYDAESLIPDPLTDNESESCFRLPWVGQFCVTWYALKLRGDNLRRGSSDLELTPSSDGSIVLTAVINDVSVDWNARAVGAEIPYSGSGTITAEAITITTRLLASVQNDRVHVDLSELDVTSQGFVFDWHSWMYDVAGFFNLDASRLVRGYVEDAIESAVVDMVPPLVERTLQNLKPKTMFELFGNRYPLEARPYGVAVDDEGITLFLQTFLDPAEWRVSHETLGSLYRRFHPSHHDATPGLVASFSLDFLNQALHAFWGGGLLNRELEANALGVDPSMLAFMLPSLADVEKIVVNAHLPPVAMPGRDEHLVDLRAYDIEISMHSGDTSDPSTLLLHLFIGLEVALDLTVTDEAKLAAEFSDINAWIDVTEPILPNNKELDTEKLLLTLIPLLSGPITSALGEIPIPEVAGLSLADPVIEVATNDGGYITIAGELTGL